MQRESWGFYVYSLDELKEKKRQLREKERQLREEKNLLLAQKASPAGKKFTLSSMLSTIFTISRVSYRYCLIEKSNSFIIFYFILY